MMRSTAATTPPLDAAAVNRAVCPYLRSADGGWRAATAIADHRCHAVDPPALLAPDKQRRLCLTERHAGCATFLAAAGHAPDVPAPDVVPAAGSPTRRPGSRAVVRTAPLVLDRGRPSLRPTLVGTPRLGQLGLIGVLGLAFVAILIARPTIGDGNGGTLAGGGASGSPSASLAGAPTSSATALATASATPTTAASPSPTPTTTPTPSLSPSPTPTASPPPTASPEPSATRTYTVKGGDTLAGIAAQYGTTWQILAKLNDLADPTRLRVGQVLLLP